MHGGMYRRKNKVLVLGKTFKMETFWKGHFMCVYENTWENLRGITGFARDEEKGGLS